MRSRASDIVQAIGSGVKDTLTPEETRHVICNSMRENVDVLYVSSMKSSNESDALSPSPDAYATIAGRCLRTTGIFHLSIV
jgi:hypothetical protein